MPVAAVTAAVGAAGVGATIYGANKASKAAKDAANAQAQGAADATAEQRREFDYVQGQNEPFRQVGLTALGALTGGLGLNVPSMTGGGTTYASTPAPGAMTGGTPIYTDRATAVGGPGSLGYGAKTGNAGVSPATPDTGAGVTMAAATPQAGGQVDWAKYLQDNPDAMANYLEIHNSGRTDQLANDPIAFAQFHYQADGARRDLPMVQAQTPAAPADPNAPKPGYTDPTAPNGYTMGPRPDAGPSPTPYVAPALDVSLASYQKSPGYDFQVSEAQRSLNNLSSAQGGVFSGARMKAAQERAVQLANQDYGQWRDYTTGQYNTDRQFGYGQARDARGDYVTDRTRSDGLYQDDRSYMTGRYDTRNNTLLNLAGFGTGATASNASAATSFATNAGNNIMTAANAKANGEINSANAWTSGANNLLTTGAYLGGRLMTGGGGGSSGLTSYLQGAAAANPNLF